MTIITTVLSIPGKVHGKTQLERGWEIKAKIDDEQDMVRTEGGCLDHILNIRIISK